MKLLTVFATASIFVGAVAPASAQHVARTPDPNRVYQDDNEILLGISTRARTELEDIHDDNDLLQRDVLMLLRALHDNAPWVDPDALPWPKPGS